MAKEPIAGQPLQVAGWREDATVSGEQGSLLLLAAKLDTGADNSSLHARAIWPFKRKGVHWVRFRVADRAGNRHRFERRLLRWATIRRAGARNHSRPVVALQLCVAGHSGLVEVTLADRAGLSHPLLVGRSFLAGKLLVDASQSHLGKGRCGGAANGNGQMK